MKHSLLLWCCLLLLESLGLVACDPLIEESSPLFRQVFFQGGVLPLSQEDTMNFRGSILGQAIKEVVQNEESFPPHHQDELGLSYEMELKEQAVLLLDYYSDQTNSRQPKGKLTSIVADILLSDEVETARLYEEIEAYLNMRYGISDGVYGQLTWNHYTSFTNNMEVRLVLNENKTQITLNFVDLQPEQALKDEAPLNP